MDQVPVNFSKRKPAKCPGCGARKVVRILYGFPADDAFDAAEKGKLVIGGCVVSECDPAWQCTGCGAQIYHERDRGFFHTSA
jgi:hypothetical protein